MKKFVLLLVLSMSVAVLAAGCGIPAKQGPSSSAAPVSSHAAGSSVAYSSVSAGKAGSSRSEAVSASAASSSRQAGTQSGAQSKGSAGSSDPGNLTVVPSKQGGIPVLCYHDIMLPEQKGSVNNGLVITTDVFDRQMAILKNAGYTVIGMEELRAYLLKGGDCSKKVVLTFDDGYKTTGYLAAPILRKYGFQATVFVIAFNLDKPDQPLNTKTFYPLQFFSSADLPKFSDVLTYGSHTYNMHVDLKSAKQSDKIEADLQLSREKLGDTAYFAYPLGKYDARVEGLLRQAGFTMAFTTQRHNARPGCNLLEIPRIEINAPITDRSFESILGIKADNKREEPQR